ncbi:glutamate racemase [Arthrobacter sp.]|uniref:glutamate racemase n=1 Tax=Arthrobacter sp. TaxID=1667 RepID=UPI003A8E4EBC
MNSHPPALPGDAASADHRLARERTAPLGIFDSGVGGLTVSRAIIDQLPHESTLYVGDTANSPYGPLPIAQVRANALSVMDELVDAGVKLLVIACNSASAAVLRDARERYTARYGIPVVEVIQPAVRRAVAATRNGRIGVIGTEATIGSRAYEDAFAAAPHLQITGAACPRFVEFVENGITTGAELLHTAERYLAPLKDAGVDTLVLGCTHYPLLTGVISYVMGDGVTLVSSAEETAKDVYGALMRHGISSDTGRSGSHEFMSTGDAGSFEVLARRFLGPEVQGVRHVAHGGTIHPTGEIPRVEVPRGDTPGAGVVPGHQDAGARA